MTQKKAIGLLHYTAPPVVGGVESVVAYHSRLIAADGHPVRLIAGRGGEQYTQIQFHYLPLADSRHPWVLAAKAQLDQGQIPSDFGALVDQIEADLITAVQGLDILIAHNVCSLHKNLALATAVHRVCARSDAPKLIIWHHDLAWTTLRYRAELHEGWPWDEIQREWPEVKPQHVVVSALRQRELADLYHLDPDTIQVIPSGLDGGHFLKLEPQTETLLQQIPYQASPLRLFLPVRLTRRKNIELAVRAVAAIQADISDTQLLVTGPPGPHNPANQAYFDELRALRADLGIEDQVHFLAEIANEYLPDVVIADLYRVADALLLPSREEGFGIPVLEAGSVGLPLFCADIQPLHEIAGPWATYFSPDCDPAALADLIVSTLQRDIRYQLRRHIRQHFTWSGVFSRQIAPLLE